MRKITLNVLAIMLMVNLLAGCVTPQSGVIQPTAIPTIPAGANKFVIGVITSDPASAYRLYQPLADYLATKLRIHNFVAGEVKTAPDIETMAQWLETGKVHIVFDGVYPTMRLRDLGNAKPIMRQWKDDDSQFSSVIFVNLNSGINSLDGLKGKIIAIESPTSTAGYLLPLGLLIESGYKTRRVDNLQASVPEDTIGYYFTGHDENTIQIVLTEKAPAGAVGSLFFYSRLPGMARDVLSVITESEKITQQVVVVSPTLEDKIVTSIQSILRGMETDEEGKAITKNLGNTSRFDDIDPSTIFDRARHYLNQIYTNQ